MGRESKAGDPWEEVRSTDALGKTCPVCSGPNISRKKEKKQERKQEKKQEISPKGRGCVAPQRQH